MPLQFFLKIDGVNGDSTVKGFERWFKVDGYDIGVQTPFSTTSATGRAEFSPLTVDIHSLAGLSPLFSDEVLNRAIKSVELVGVDNGKRTVYDLKLSDAFVSSFENSPGTKGVDTALTFHYGQLSLTDRPPTTTGRLGTPETFAFDLNQLQAAAAVSASDLVSAAATGGSVASGAPAVPAASPLQYFLKIDGVNGDSTVKGFERWFKVDGYDIGVQTPFSTTSATGRAEFSPLTVDIHSLAGLSPLFSDEVLNRAIKSVELVGVDNGKRTVYDLKLSDAFVSSFENSPGTKGVDTALTFHYGQLSLTDRPPTTTGRLGTPETFAFDLNQLQAAAAVSASDLVSAAATGGSVASGAPAVPAASPLQYFLKIDGVNGDSTVKGFERWFKVDGYDIGVQTPFSTTSATGRAEFSPLTVDIHSLAGLSPLFSDEVLNRAIKSVELVGVDNGKRTVYDLKLSDAFVSSFENSPGTKGVDTALTFHYGQLSLTDRPPTTTGRLGTPETFAFDLNQLQAAAAVSASDLVSAAATGGSVASGAPAVPAASPLQYFLKIDGVNGDSTVKGFERWFKVDGYDIGVQTPFSTTSATGRAEFSPLTVDIHSLAGLSPLFSDEVLNRAIKSVELVGVDNGKRTVYDLKLSDAFVSSFENSPGTKGVDTALTFHYGQLSLTDRPPTTTGRLGTPETFAFDLNQLQAAAAVSASDLVSAAATGGSVASGAPAVPAASPLQYFLKIDGVNGDSTVKGFERWFKVDGYDIGVQTPFSTTSATGRAEFSPLTVDIHSLAGLSPLFSDEVLNRAIKSVELVGVDNGKRTVYDLKLSDAFVSSFENSPGTKGVDTALTFHYGQLSLTDRPPTTTGRLGTPETFAFDLNQLQAAAAVSASDLVSAAATGGSVASGAPAVPAASPLQYFLKIDGVNGDSTVKGFERWFKVDGYDIGVQTPFSTTSATGRAEFSPLTVDIHSLAGLSPLFSDEVLNRAIKSVELVGVDNGKRTVYDLKLSDAFVSSFENSPGTKGVDTALTFHYGQLSLTDRPPTTTGRLGTPETFAFDLNQLQAAAAVSASDLASASQLNNAALSLASFIASSDIGSSGSQYLGSSGSQPLANTLLTQQDSHLPTTLVARS